MRISPIMDWEREARIGLVEAVYADGKSVSFVSEIIARAAECGQRLLVTRLSKEAHAQLSVTAAKALDYDVESQTAILGAIAVDPPKEVVIVCGGMSDLFVVHEVRRTLLFAGIGSQVVADVGVAGLWRLIGSVDEIKKYPVVVAVAGMEGAIFSVLAGLISAPVIAVPTSVGYGVSEGGQLALNSALGSCAPGLVTVNINNGFGAAQAALRVLNQLGRVPAKAT